MPSTDQPQRVTDSSSEVDATARSYGAGDQPIPQQRPPYDPTEQTDEPEAEPTPERTTG